MRSHSSSLVAHLTSGDCRRIVCAKRAISPGDARDRSQVVASGVAGTIAGVALIGCGGASAAAPQQDGRSSSPRTTRRCGRRSTTWRAGGDPPTSPPPAEVIDQAAELQDQVALARRPSEPGRPRDPAAAGARCALEIAPL